jgi:hypothetical protein
LFGAGGVITGAGSVFSTGLMGFSAMAGALGVLMMVAAITASCFTAGAAVNPSACNAQMPAMCKPSTVAMMAVRWRNAAGAA